MQSNNIQRQFWCTESVHLCASGRTATSHNFTLFYYINQVTFVTHSIKNNFYHFKILPQEKWLTSIWSRMRHTVNKYDKIRSVRVRKKNNFSPDTHLYTEWKIFCNWENLLKLDIRFTYTCNHSPFRGGGNLWYWCLSLHPPPSLSHTDMRTRARTPTHTHTQTQRCACICSVRTMLTKLPFYLLYTYTFNLAALKSNFVQSNQLWSTDFHMSFVYRPPLELSYQSSLHMEKQCHFSGTCTKVFFNTEHQPIQIFSFMYNRTGRTNSQRKKCW